MRVLITRTRDDAAATARALEALGHKAVVAPLRERIALDNPLPEGPFDAIIATSRHAFFGSEFSGFSWPAALTALPCFCVGLKTAQAARDAGFVHAQALGGDGAALALALLSRIKPGQRLLYLAGKPRHPALEQALEAGGLHPVVSERYAMQRVKTLPEIARAALTSASIGAVLHYSRESAGTYLELSASAGLGAAALAPLQLCLSDAVASVFEAKMPGVTLRIASAPHEAALLAALKP